MIDSAGLRNMSFHWYFIVSSTKRSPGRGVLSETAAVELLNQADAAPGRAPDWITSSPYSLKCSAILWWHSLLMPKLLARFPLSTPSRGGDNSFANKSYSATPKGRRFFDRNHLGTDCEPSAHIKRTQVRGHRSPEQRSRHQESGISN